MVDTDNIKQNPERFYEFLGKLNDVTSWFRKNSFNNGSDDLPYIIEELNKMLMVYRRVLRVNCPQKGLKSLDIEMDEFIKSFFDSFSNKTKMCSYFKDKSSNYFLNRKLYQLSHSHGIYNRQIEKNEDIDIEIKNLILSHMFIDYYESFPMYLKPFLLRLWKKKYKPTPRLFKTFDIYYHLCILLPNSFIWDTIVNRYKNIRNRIAHSDAIILGKKLEYIDEKSRTVRYDRIDSIKEDMELFHNIVITFATEFDISFLSLGLNGKESYFKDWFAYLEIYNQAWQRIGKKSPND